MKEDLYTSRKSYEKGALSEKSVANNPLQQFKSWYSECLESGGVVEVNAMTLTTIDLEGFPRGRVVLLKKYDAFGFYFYTNYDSEKGKSIEINNKVSLSFFWPNMERQIIIKGTAKRTSNLDSEKYFHSRPKGSQIGALVSNQSTVIKNRDVLENHLKELELEYENKEVPKPTNWGGYIVTPLTLEFWQGRPNRLHDRIRYTLDKGSWIIQRLAP